MICIVQARMGSSRLPGKTMKKLFGKSILLRVLERLKKSKKITKIIIATSNTKKDNQIVNFCKKNNYSYFRANLKNVLERFKKLVIKTKTKSFVRVSADSPFIDPQIIDKAINIYINKKADIVTNIFPRTFPKGQSVEIINSKIFLKTCRIIKKKIEKEHITKHFYNNHNKYKIINFSAPKNLNHLNQSVDTIRDFEQAKKILSFSKNKFIGYKKIALLQIKELGVTN